MIVSATCFESSFDFDARNANALSQQLESILNNPLMPLLNQVDLAILRLHASIRSSFPIEVLRA
jgi:hypothetical protein